MCELKNKSHFYPIPPGLNYPPSQQPLLTNSLCILPERKYTCTQGESLTYTDIPTVYSGYPNTIPTRNKIDSDSLLDELVTNELLLFAIGNERQESKIPIM